MRFTSLLIVFAAMPALAAPPSISSLSSSSVPRSGRFEILGAGFGERPLSPDARVEIGGVPAATATWTDGRIVAYVNRAVAVGPASLRVVTSEGASADVPFEVLPLPAANGGVSWTFVANGTSSWQRPAVGPDGRVYAGDDRGFIYALDADGALEWIRHGPSVGGHDGFFVGESDKGTLTVGADGTIYVAVDLLGPDLQIQAYRPDGTLAWIYTEPGGQLTHGLEVGPDGNVYLSLALLPIGGLRILDPNGNLVGSETENVAATGSKQGGIRGAEITFGPSTRGGPVDRLYLVSEMLRDDSFSRGSLQAHRLDGPLEWARNACKYANNSGLRTFGFPAVTPDGDVLLTGTRGPGKPLALHLLDISGDLVWSYDPVSSNLITEPEADPRGGAYFVTNSRFLHSVGAGGARRWVRELVGRVEYGPVVHPDGESAVVVATSENGTRLVSVKPEGALGWRIDLPAIDGVDPTPSSRLRFAGSGGRAYLPTILLGSEDRWALYAVDTPASQPQGTGGTGGGEAGSGGSGGAGGTGGDGGSGGDDGPDASGGSGGDDAPAPGARAARHSGGCSTSGAQGPTSLALAIAIGLAAGLRRRAKAPASRSRTEASISTRRWDGRRTRE